MKHPRENPQDRMHVHGADQEKGIVKHRSCVLSQTKILLLPHSQ